VLGRFHELSIPTRDIRASVEFYERLGFTQAQTGEVWTHPYGVLTDGRVALGLHQHPGRGTALTFVHPQIAEHSVELERRGMRFAYRRIGADMFHEIGVLGPDGELLVVLETRTYSPSDRSEREPSRLGEFRELTLPAADLEVARTFWEPLGFVSVGESREPYPRLALTSDHLNLAFHPRRMLASPLLVFGGESVRAPSERLRDLGIETSSALPRELDPRRNALIEAPEGTLLLVTEDPQASGASL